MTNNQKKGETIISGWTAVSIPTNSALVGPWGRRAKAPGIRASESYAASGSRNLL